MDTLKKVTDFIDRQNKLQNMEAEIERLREALQAIYDLHHTEMSELERNDRTYDIVYAALGNE
jgi:hypothetical protein